MGRQRERGVTRPYPPFIEERIDNLLSDRIIGEGWNAVQVFFTAVRQETEYDHKTDTTAPASCNNSERYLWEVTWTETPSEGELCREINVMNNFCSLFPFKGRNLWCITTSTPLWQVCVCVYTQKSVCVQYVSALCASRIDVLYLPSVSCISSASVCHHMSPVCVRARDTRNAHNSSLQPPSR